jgi:hypothetical protein
MAQDAEKLRLMLLKAYGNVQALRCKGAKYHIFGIMQKKLTS